MSNMDMLCSPQSSNVGLPTSPTAAPSSTTVSKEDEDEEAEEEKHFPAPITRLRDVGTSSRILQRSFGGARGVGRGRINDHCVPDWRAQTADYYTRPEDCHNYRGQALPFCVTRCNTNSLVAIGDEEGGVRLIDSAYADNSFSQHHTSRIVDMHTQQTRYVMHSHTSSVKQVRFQPGNDSIVATSSRDGSVMIWDLRCRGQDAPVVDYAVSFEPGNSMVNSARRANTVTYASSVNSMRDAHGLQQESRRSDISVTAVSFLSDSRSHLLLTATEANASVKLWDLRGKYTSRRNGPSVPVSSTREPEAHFKHRQFGISSLALSGDGSRFYALCRDSTSTSFYVKSALRPATSSHPEMLAVGSREGCAVLFPTDEAFLKKKSPQPSPGISTPIIGQDGAYGPRSRTGSAAKFEDTSLPIYNQGTALIRAHGRSEVTGLAWSTEGELVTLDMRICGEGQGARWGWGWADVEGYDEEEG
ncbi:unnamed protein product [Aureobasidium pullulans]|nr:unnamed protein product [Aureobasidium pullulans]